MAELQTLGGFLASGMAILSNREEEEEEDEEAEEEEEAEEDGEGDGEGGLAEMIEEKLDQVADANETIGLIAGQTESFMQFGADQLDGDVDGGEAKEAEATAPAAMSPGERRRARIVSVLKTLVAAIIFTVPLLVIAFVFEIEWLKVLCYVVIPSKIVSAFGLWAKLRSLTAAAEEGEEEANESESSGCCTVCSICSFC